MTRGRWSNVAYVATDHAHLEHHQRDPGGQDEEITARTVLHGVLHHSGSEASAHEVLQAEQERWTSIAQLAAEYDTLAAAAQHHRWTDLIRHSGLDPAQADAVLTSDAFGPLTAPAPAQLWPRPSRHASPTGRAVTQTEPGAPTDQGRDCRTRHSVDEPRRAFGALPCRT